MPCTFYLVSTNDYNLLKYSTILQPGYWHPHAILPIYVSALQWILFIRFFLYNVELTKCLVDSNMLHPEKRTLCAYGYIYLAICPSFK